MTRRRTQFQPELPAELVQDIVRAGYFPALVGQVVAVAIAGEDVRAHFVHQETTFDTEEVRRHATVLVITPTRFIVAHADDHGPDANNPTSMAAASTESVAISAVRSVVLQHVVDRPEAYRPGEPPQEVSLTIGWGSLQRVDLEPATCGDPNCEADHGYTGSLAGDDITLRVSAAAEGATAVAAVLDFAAALSAATSGR